VTLSVIIITKDEARHIEACLRSVAFATERIVVDSGSSDNTVELARACGARVIERPDWIGFGAQKNRALAEASGEWVLSIDADERVGKQLETEIRAAMLRDDADGFDIARLTYFYGHPVRHARWSPNTPSIRLFRRHQGRFREVVVHENVELFTQRRGALKTPLEHFSFVDPDGYLRKINLYSTLSAGILHERGRRAGIFLTLLHTWAAFFKAYFVERAVLDGRVGLMIAIMAAEVTYHKYLKLTLLNEAAGPRTRPQVQVQQKAE
jgi:glycosyltransferase involved in cell wall biosynthesis